MDYTDTQEKQLAYLDKMERKESLYTEKFYICQCKTCGVRETLQSAGTVSALFMAQHVGHKTWITTGQ